MDPAAIHLVIQGQKERNVLEESKKGYLSRMSTLTRILNDSYIRLDSIETDDDGLALMHTGQARKLCKLKLPIAEHTAEVLFAAISVDPTLPRKRKVRTEIDDCQEVEEDLLNPGKNLVTVSAQTYQNYKSALRWWHEYDCPAMDKIGHPWPPKVDLACKTAIAAYKRDIGAKKRRGIMNPKEGKSAFNLDGYVALCKHFCMMRPDGNKVTWNEGLFAGLFTKLSVGTIGRSDNIDDINMAQMDWPNDALQTAFCTTKADQAGESTSDVKRLYANPFNPAICIALHLAVYSWCKRRDDSNNIRLFDGKDQNKRYYNILMQAVREIDPTVDLGCRREDIGTHSNRKFAESTSVSKIDGPSRTQVCLRAGQGVGKTQDCYMFQEECGDALVGRTTAQLKMTPDEFDILPPHFDNETLQYLVEFGWENIIDGFAYYSESWKNRILPKLLASLVYHWSEGNLQDLYPADHPIFAQRIFTDQTLIKSLASKVILVHNYCQKTHMSAEGVPGIILITRELREFRKHYDNTCSNYDNRIAEFSALLKTAIDDVPKVVVNMILEKFRIDGVVPMTAADIRAMIIEVMGANDSPYAKLSEQLSVTNSQLSHHGAILERLDTGTNTRNRLTTADVPSSCGDVHTWPDVDGRFHRVPLGFKFPSYNVQTMWNLWFFGDSTNRICPYRYIEPKYDLVTKHCRTNRSRTVKVIGRLVALNIEEGNISKLRDVTKENTQVLFDYAYPLLIAECYDEMRMPTRRHDININTIANRMKK